MSRNSIKWLLIVLSLLASVYSLSAQGVLRGNDTNNVTASRNNSTKILGNQSSLCILYNH